jgi:hypothetical protein
LVNAEYKYLRSSWSWTFCLSSFVALFEPMRRDDQSEDMPDMTLRTLDTECTESRSEDFCLFRWAELRKET